MQSSEKVAPAVCESDESLDGSSRTVQGVADPSLLTQPQTHSGGTRTAPMAVSKSFGRGEPLAYLLGQFGEGPATAPKSLRELGRLLGCSHVTAGARLNTFRAGFAEDLQRLLNT